MEGRFRIGPSALGIMVDIDKYRIHTLGRGSGVEYTEVAVELGDLLLCGVPWKRPPMMNVPCPVGSWDGSSVHKAASGYMLGDFGAHGPGDVPV